MKISNYFYFGILTIIGVLLPSTAFGQDANLPKPGNNLAKVASASTSLHYDRWMQGINDGETPTDSIRWRPRNLENPPTDQWTEYEWAAPVTTKEVALFFWDYYGVIPLPETFTLTYWNGDDFVPVKNQSTTAPSNGMYSLVTFDEIQTTKLRVETKALLLPLNITEWVVYQTPGSPNHPPIVTTNGDRDVMLNGKTYLSGEVKAVTKADQYQWQKVSGPGEVSFSDANSLEGSATFSTVGDYVLQLDASEKGVHSSSTLKVKVHPPLKKERLDVVYTKRYKIDNPLWNDRAKALITSWIPYCIDQCNRTDLERGAGGLDNFIEAAKALRGEPHGKHLGYVFSNAWVHQTVEAMSIALMVDPQGDKEIIAAQAKMRETLEDWIPKILAAQEPDGYLQTAYTLRDSDGDWEDRWSENHRSTHEGYVAGYFIESAINHYTLTEGKDTRLYDAAKKLADCWVRNIGPEPGKQAWYDGHQEMEQALVRFGRFVNDMEGNGRGDDYIDLAKFLLDNRGGGSEYDQSHVPVQQQYEAVGHAVRATYNYSGMADVAAETGDVDYQSAVMSLWNNMVNKKYYVTGGIGSGETSEGFGPNYSLRNNAYAESCSSAGLIFFQYKMNLAYHDAKYADLYEETMYNALLGSLDLPGENFYYTNPLDSFRGRNAWHGCPCCVGNIPRTLLMIPTWTYVKSNDGIYVNLFIGSTIKVEKVAGTDVEMVQKTNYPWDGKVAITVNPEESKEFSVYVRIPNRKTSELYTLSPAINGFESFKVNGKSITPKMEEGYAVVTRKWKKGDKIEFELPMKIQVITADDQIEADRGKIALRYGPLIYNVEQADQKDLDKSLGSKDFELEWRDDLLHGVMVIKGEWADGTPLLAIPNYARHNRDETPLSESDRTNEDAQEYARENNNSKVWIND
ncbi:glycoside hydrolase family 127 protein [Flagellimonas iocasae]|uniref:Glycoside hydrolase family 127 protein n=1 Tax=Flagellimonas iocasae TaxID=2055905 RepID=A0ABW4XUZ8_9FLAO